MASVQRFLTRSSGGLPSGGSKTEVDLTVDFRGLDSTLTQTLSPHGFIGRTVSRITFPNIMALIVIRSPMP
jgi:hypothetical protein